MALASVRAGEFGRYLQVNAAMAELTGYSQDELLTMSGPDITHPDDVAMGIEVSRRMVNGELETRDARQALRPRRRQDHLGAREHLARPRRRRRTRCTPWCRSRTSRSRSASRPSSHYQAYHDSLTGLPNRRKLMNDLEARLEAERSEPTLLLRVRPRRLQGLQRRLWPPGRRRAARPARRAPPGRRAGPRSTRTAWAATSSAC